MIAALALAAAMAGSPRQTLTEYRPIAVGDWTYRIRDDSFTGQRTCRLRSRHVVYRRGVLMFSLGHRVDTAAALYRIDGGQVLDPHGDDLAVAAAGLALHADDLDNASAGLVRIPARRVMDVKVVSIRPSAHAGVASFPVAGLREALAQEARYGCLADTIASDVAALYPKAASAPAAVDRIAADQAAGLTGGAGADDR